VPIVVSLLAGLCFVHLAELVELRCRFELADPGVAMGGFFTKITHKGAIMPWQTTHHFLKTYYMPLILRPLGFFTGLRCLLGANHCNCLISTHIPRRPSHGCVSKVWVCLHAIWASKLDSWLVHGISESSAEHSAIWIRSCR
jgi:hypothetical protein